MNLKKTFLSVMAAGAILAGGFSGAAAQTASGTTSGTVRVNNTGQFNAQFCGSVDFGTVDLDSRNAATAKAESHVEICYTDTQAHRGTFRTYMRAGNFNGSGFNIPAEGLRPTMIHNVGQGQWGPGIGNIGAMKGDSNYGGGDGGYVNSAANAGPWVGGTLDESQYVGYGNAGIGTGGKMYLPLVGGHEDARLENGSVARIGLELKIPSNTPQGDFTSTFTLNVNPATP